MEDDIKVSVELLLEDNISDTLAAIIKQLSTADRAIAATSVAWEGLRFQDHAPHSPVLATPEPPRVEQPLASLPDVSLLAPMAPSAAPSAPASSDLPSPVGGVPQETLHQQPGPVVPNYAPMLPDTPSPRDGWFDGPNVGPSVRTGHDNTAAMLDRHASAPIAPDTVASAPASVDLATNTPTFSVAPIPLDNRPAAAPAASRPGDIPRNPELPSNFAPLPAVPAESMAPRGLDPAATASQVANITPAAESTSGKAAIAPEADAGGGEGQLLLDGSLLGRWIIDHLAREADRPSAGGTAFDPRQGNPWLSNG